MRLDVTPFLDVPHVDGGRTMDGADCFGLARLVVHHVAGVWLDEWSGTTSRFAIAHRLQAEAASHGWREIPIGEERHLDFVLMTGVIGKGLAARTAPLHVGVVVEPGWMIDSEAERGPLVRAFRDTATARKHHTVGGRVIGVFRPEALEGWTP